MKKFAVLLSFPFILCSCTKNTASVTETTLAETVTSLSIETTETVPTETAVEEASETVLQRAIRLGKAKAGDNSSFPVIFSDIDGDSFPEMVTDIYGHNVYKYFDEIGWLGIYNGEDPCSFIRNTYYDKAADSYFHVDIMASCICDYIEWSCKTTYSENGETISVQNPYVWYYPDGFWSEKGKGGFAEYSSNGKYSLMYFNDWNEPTFDIYRKFVEDSYSEYGLINSIDIGRAADALLEKYSSENEKDYILDGEFADEPTLLMGKPSGTKPDIIAIGDRGYNEDSTGAYLHGDEITEENFEKLAKLPKLTSLSISCDTPSELNGISKLANLKMLTLNMPIDNSDELKKLTSLESLHLYPADNIDFLRNMDSVRVLYLCYTLDKPDDYYAPVADMDSLEYLAIDFFERSITDEQDKWLAENLTDVKLSFYKFG